MLETLSQLNSDIRQMENMIAYYEGRILRKRIAIEEMRISHEARQIDVATEPLPKDNLTVTEMLTNALASVNGDTYTYQQLADLTAEVYPWHTEKIKRGIYMSCMVAVRSGTLVSAEGGYKKP